MWRTRKRVTARPTRYLQGDRSTATWPSLTQVVKFNTGLRMPSGVPSPQPTRTGRSNHDLLTSRTDKRQLPEATRFSSQDACPFLLAFTTIEPGSTVQRPAGSSAKTRLDFLAATRTYLDMSKMHRQSSAIHLVWPEHLTET